MTMPIEVREAHMFDVILGALGAAAFWISVSVVAFFATRQTA